ncbi:hypothetical protein C3747_54g154 [Trypanosoma cruzi]|uniref:Leucine-rich repeat protein (LRRP) n=2 Tax=Trypanosoma cruzi TaxID=5693 RepID=Q4E2X6_TRYCC|nr:hypothetical protein, conserved [Trypanosoma cruzi]EAN99124.1 hypothetical protein, conserved [Trypanosoma cruzi]PWV12093.1 hypothetical protein C3747_54g154 [Trypanosoma cruzi]RNC45330.1 hypothetical protein TcCL_NonESM04924 [Trypanosoma cruzi]|eukprot:XP_820975.1 hypothetical protein [Trypanosoma cruzi strain CL Brener]
MRPQIAPTALFSRSHRSDGSEMQQARMSFPAPPQAVTRCFLGDSHAGREEERQPRHRPLRAMDPTTTEPSLPFSAGVSFAALRSIAAYLTPDAPLALVACSPYARLALEVREKGYVLPGNLRFERRPGPAAAKDSGQSSCSETNAQTKGSHTRRTSISDSGGSIVGENLVSDMSAYFSPPQELLQFLTSHKTSPSRAACGGAAALRPRPPAAAAAQEEGAAASVAAMERTTTRASDKITAAAAAPTETSTSEALQYALWWVRRSPLPVSMSLHSFDADEVRLLTAQLQSPTRRILLRELFLHGQQVSDVTPFLPHCTDVRALVLRNTHLTSEKLGLLPQKCRHVERLSLCMSSSVSCTRFLRHRSLCALRDLDLSYTQVTEEGMYRDVSKLNKLSRLSLEGCRKIESLQWLRALNQLRVLDLGYSSVTDDSLTALRFCPELAKLDLQWCGRITSLMCLVGALCDSLRELNLTETSVTDEGLVPLKDFAALEWISLEGCGAVSDVNVLCNLTRLREVDVGRTRVTNRGVVSLSQCQALRVMRMRQCYRLTDANFLGALQQLEEVDLSDCPVTNEGIAALFGARSLRKLRLQSCHAVNDVNFLGGLEHLMLLDLHHTTVDEEGSVGLAQCPQLMTLIMHSVLVHSLQQWNAALFLPRLKRLDLSTTKVTSDALSFLRMCPVLETLSLRGCKNITHLDFLILQPSSGTGVCAIVPRDVEPHDTVGDIIAGKEKNPDDGPSPIETMTTNDGVIKSTAVAAVVSRHRLRELTLSGTGVTDEGLRALQYCPGLERLRLAHCKNFTDVAVLRWLSQLKELDLSATGVTGSGLAKLSPSGNLPARCMGGREWEEEGGVAGDKMTGVRCMPTGCVALEKLWLQSCPHVENIRLLCGFPQLKELFLIDTPLRQRGLDMSVLYHRNPNLKQIHHSNITIFV